MAVVGNLVIAEINDVTFIVMRLCNFDAMGSAYRPA
jgi:hypothetical protein